MRLEIVVADVPLRINEAELAALTTRTFLANEVLNKFQATPDALNELPADGSTIKAATNAKVNHE